MGHQRSPLRRSHICPAGAHLLSAFFIAPITRSTYPISFAQSIERRYRIEDHILSRSITPAQIDVFWNTGFTMHPARLIASKVLHTECAAFVDMRSGRLGPMIGPWFMTNGR